MNSNINSQFGPQNVPIFTQPAPIPEPGLSSPISASSIQKSELEAIALLVAAGIPVLMPPDVNGNFAKSSKADQIAALGLSMEAKKADIISKLWDNYIENIREVAEKIKKDDIRRETEDADKAGPMSSVQYFNYLMSISSTQKADEMDGNGLVVQFNQAFNQWMNPAVQGAGAAGAAGVAGAAAGGVDPATAPNSGVGAYPSASFIAGSIASNPDAVRLAIGQDSAVLGVFLSSSPVADALFAAGPTSGLPGDYQAAAAMVAALLNGGAVFKATAETLVNASGKPQYDLNFAVNYAKNVMAIVTKDIGQEDPADPNRAKQNNMVRLMLSAMALNMVYRAAYGGMEGKEFADILAGHTGDIPSEIRGLVEQLAGFVNKFLPTDRREETIARLREYVDSKESVDSMLETTRLFTGSLASNVDASRITESSL